MIKVVVKPNIFELEPKIYEVPHVPGFSVLDYITQGQNQDLEQLFVKLKEQHEPILKTGAVQFLYNHRYIEYHHVPKILPKDNDIIHVIISPKGGLPFLVQLLIGMIISMGISFVLGELMRPPKPEEPTNEAELEASQTYTWEGPTTSYALGRPIPYAYGRHGTGGNIINAMVEGLPASYTSEWRGDPTADGSRPRDGKYSLITVPRDWIPSTPAMDYWWSATPADARTSPEGFYLAAPILGGTPRPIGHFISDLYADWDRTSDYNTGRAIRPIFYEKFRAWFPNEQERNYTEVWGAEDTATSWQASGHYMRGWKLFYRTLNWNRATDEVTVATPWAPMPGFDPNHDGRHRWETCEWPDIDWLGAGQVRSPYTNADDSSLGEFIDIYIEAHFCHEVSGVNHISYGAPYFKIEYQAYGMVPSSEAEFARVSHADGLRMVLALSAGEINDINIATLHINDTRHDFLYDIPDIEGFTSPLEIQANQGSRYPTIKYGPDDNAFSYVNMFNKRQLGSAQFDYQIGEDDSGQYFRYDTQSTCSSIDIHVHFKKGLYYVDRDRTDEFAGIPEPQKVAFYVGFVPTSQFADPTQWRWLTSEGIISEKTALIIEDAKPESFKMVFRLGNDNDPLPANDYTVTVTRSAIPEDDIPASALVGPWRYNEAHISKITELGYEFLRYPEIALLGLRMIATDKISGASPKINVEVRGRYIKCPILRYVTPPLGREDLIVPIERAYTRYESGSYVWYEKEDDGTASGELLTASSTDTMYQYTCNPALIIYDILTTQDLYPFIPENIIPWSDVVTAAAFCWEYIESNIVSDSTEHRYECNIIIDGTIDAAQLLSQLSNIFRLKLVWIGNQLRMKVLKEEVPTQIFSEGDILPGTYKEIYRPTAEVPNTLDVSFYDENEKYKQSVVQVSTKDSEVGKSRIIKESVSLLGTTRLTQAIRIAKYLLAHFTATQRTVQFQTGLRGFVSVPGDVIRLHHSTITHGYNGFFREPSSGTTHYLDRMITVPADKAGDYRFEVQYASTKTSEYVDVYFDPVSAPHTFDQIVDTLVGTPTIGDSWLLIPITDVGLATEVIWAKDYRILNMQTDLEAGKITIDCEPYVESIYSEDPLSGRSSPYRPPYELPSAVFPPDVVNLTLAQTEVEYAINVTYNIPMSPNEAVYFEAAIISVTSGDGTYTITYDANDYQLRVGTTFQIYNGTSGSTRGTMRIESLDIINNIIVAVAISNNFSGSITVGDVMVQRGPTGNFLAVDQVEIYTSWTGLAYTHHGIDASLGRGYTIGVSSTDVGRRLWVRVRTVSAAGVTSRNPAVESIVIGSNLCLPSPGHLSLCGQGDGVENFLGCDICISWTRVSTFQGGGTGEDATAGNAPAGLVQDLRINRYSVWVYDNGGNTPQFIREVGTSLLEFTYTHDMNKEDQYNVFARTAQGQRKILFRVYQEDRDGNVSCNPTELAVENTAPSMSGYVPSVTSPAAGTIIVNWSSYVNDPALMATDILGFELWYGTTSSDMTSIDLPYTAGETETQYRITGLVSGDYVVYLIPYDCFGVGSPRSAYRSVIIQVTVGGYTLPPYPPPVPQGMTGSILIDSVDIQATYYEIRLDASADLHNDFGFELVTDPGDPEAAYLAMNYHYDRIYYNTDEDIAGYCYVTGSDLNSNNNVTALYYSTSLAQWCVRVGIPSVPQLNEYGYEAADGVPQVGQKCAINIWAELGYTNIGGIWDSGLSTVVHGRWQHPDPASAQVDRLTHYEFNIYRSDGLLTRNYNEPVDQTKVLGGYYTTDIIGITPEKELDVSLKLWSDAGDVGTGLYCNDVQVIKETADYLMDQILVNWSVAALADGTEIQVAIDNWDEYWQDERVRAYEIYACLRQWDFVAGDWEAAPVTEFMALASSGDSGINRYQEFERTIDGHLRLVNVDASANSYFFLGSTEGPIFHWSNGAASDEGGICTHYSEGPPVVCAQGCTDDVTTGNCPYGVADSRLSCCAANSYYQPDASAASDRTREGINYNRYFVALAVRTTQGRRIWYTDGAGDLIWKEADFELIDRMHIKDASITTAKIGDAMINNAKIKSLSADKVWIGDYPGTWPWQPFKEHCVWDYGDRCLYHGWTEDEVPPTGYFKTGTCPVGYSTWPSVCNYTQSEFAISRIFAIYGQDPSHASEYTYINGGMILTNSIRARSIQIGALPYTADIQVTRLFDLDPATPIEPDSYVRIKWHKAGEYQGVYDDVNPMINGRIEFADDSGFYITAGETLFTLAASEVPDGTTVKRIMHVGYVEYINAASHESVLFAQYDLTETTADFDYDGTFSDLRRHGNIPLFAVVIVNNIPDLDGQQAIDGRNLIDPGSIIESDVGQFRVHIIMIAASPGTYIQNNDITTGVIHNPYWTSYLDMRHYTGYNSGDNYRGHARLIIDGPSSVYERSMMSTHGDQFGKEWWEYTATWPVAYGADTKFLIGRPWIEGLESQLPDIPSNPLIKSARLEGEELADQGYMWFYRTYNKLTDRWEGNLEIGGKLRFKDLTNYREVLVGQAYTQQETAPFAWYREDSPGLYLYDTEGLYAVSETSPIKLAQIGGISKVAAVTGAYTTHYFDVDPEDAQMTMWIDYRNEVPAEPLATWGYTTLGITPCSLSGVYGNTSSGLMIRSQFLQDFVGDDTYGPGDGIVVYGNLNTYGVSVYIYKDIDNDTCTAVQGIVDNGGGFDSVAFGVRGVAVVGNGGGWAEGITAQAQVGSGNGTAIAGRFICYHFDYPPTSRIVGISIDTNQNVDPSGVGYAAHIHFDDRRTGGWLGSLLNPPHADWGVTGDLMASDGRLWYKTSDAGWRALQYVT